jgi:hypothetical protein
MVAAAADEERGEETRRVEGREGREGGSPKLYAGWESGNPTVTTVFYTGGLVGERDSVHEMAKWGNSSGRMGTGCELRLATCDRTFLF